MRNNQQSLPIVLWNKDRSLSFEVAKREETSVPFTYEAFSRMGACFVTIDRSFEEVLPDSRLVINDLALMQTVAHCARTSGAMVLWLERTRTADGFDQLLVHEAVTNIPLTNIWGFLVIHQNTWSVRPKEDIRRTIVDSLASINAYLADDQYEVMVFNKADEQIESWAINTGGLKEALRFAHAEHPDCIYTDEQFAVSQCVLKDEATSFFND